MAPQDNDYGFVGHDEIEKGIGDRLAQIDSRKLEQVAQVLSEAVQALLTINSAIPVQSRQRHLVAQALERFVGTEGKDTHTKP